MKRLLIIVAGCAALAALFAAVNFRSYLTAPVAELTEPVLFEVQSGQSLSGVARQLGAQGLLSRPYVFISWGRFTGQAALLKAGEYELLPGATPKSILDQLVAGEVKLYPVTILEGWTIREVRAALAGMPEIRAVLDTLPREDWQETLGLSADHPEGQFYPETYMVPRGTSDVEVLRQAAELMQQQLDSAWADRAADLPLKNPYELLILASIIERETALDSERPEVAGVFVRRIRKGMRLQTDPTVIYGLGESFDGNLTRKHLLTDTPYNTYTRGGLPPTPIGMPSAASLQAAARPAKGDSLYFVATGEPDGSHVFSRTLEEHNAAVAAYIAKLRQQRRQKQ